ncbi:MAG: hypothetical protein NTX44_02715 [Ignavibacteriales bacterium]|nr:hypothetical protein [Ignavibacteriales bacterium]
MIPFDIIQSYIIKGVIILIILQAMLLLQNLLYQHTEKAALEGELSTASFTFSSEMRQAGYNSSATPFTIAETSRVEIVGDIDNNGSVEQVRYYLAPMPTSTKFFLMRTVNGGTPFTAGKNFRKFYLTYYDSTGHTTSDLTKIKSISVLATIENDAKFYGDYLRSSWQAQIFPPNVNK